MKLKKWIILFMAGLVPTTITLIYFLVTKKLMEALGLGFGLIILFVVIGSLLLRNPFVRILEETEYLMLTFSSNGGIIPFTLIPNGKKLNGNIGGKEIDHIYDRNAIMYLETPKTGRMAEDENCIYFALNKKDLNTSQFSMSGIPTFIWNDQLETFMTKEMVSTLETKTFARHEILYLNQSAKELNSHMLNFGRYVMDQMKPMWKIWEQGWFKWVIIIVLVGGLIYFLAPILLGGGEKALTSGAKAIAPVTIK